MPVNCGPRGLPTGFVQLFHNNGDGTFTDVSRASGVAAAAKSYPMTTVVADYDHDGWPDIYVACDSTPSWLFRNQRDGTFEKRRSSAAWRSARTAWSRRAWASPPATTTADGRVDLFKTHFADDTNGLYRGDGKGFFDDVTIRAGIGVETRYVGWGAGMVDLDNDGLPDLFMVTGGVYPEVERTLPAYPFRTPRLVFRNLGNGRFEELIEEAGPGVAAVHTSRGCAFGDFDNDGDVDVLVWNMNEPPSLLRNDVSGDGRWLKVLLVGTTSNRSAIGAQVTATYGTRTQVQDVTAQSSFYSVNDRRLHFGLGAATAADLSIRWPNGTTERLAGVNAGQLVVVREGAGILRAHPCGSAPRYRRARSGCRLVRAGRERERLPVVVAEHPALVQRADRDVVRAGIAEGLPFGREGAPGRFEGHGRLPGHDDPLVRADREAAQRVAGTHDVGRALARRADVDVGLAFGVMVERAGIRQRGASSRARAGRSGCTSARRPPRGRIPAFVGESPRQRELVHRHDVTGVDGDHVRASGAGPATARGRSASGQGCHRRCRSPAIRRCRSRWSGSGDW